MKELVIGALLGALLHMAGGSSPATAQTLGGGGGSSCMGSSARWDPVNEEWEVSCTGACDSVGGSCDGRTSGLGSFCSCKGSGDGSLPNSCCNIGIDRNGDIRKFGNCQACPSGGGRCVVVCGDPDEETGEIFCEPVCAG